MSIREILSECFFRQGYYHGHCMDILTQVDPSYRRESQVDEITAFLWETMILFWVECDKFEFSRAFHRTSVSRIYEWAVTHSLTGKMGGRVSNENGTAGTRAHVAIEKRKKPLRVPSELDALDVFLFFRLISVCNASWEVVFSWRTAFQNADATPARRTPSLI